MPDLIIELHQEGGVSGRMRRWRIRDDALPAAQAARLRSLAAAAWGAMTRPGAAPPLDVEPDDASAQTARPHAGHRPHWTLSCLRGDEELTCRLVDGERLPDAVEALMRFVRETGKP